MLNVLVYSISPARFPQFQLTHSLPQGVNVNTTDATTGATALLLWKLVCQFTQTHIHIHTQEAFSQEAFTFTRGRKHSPRSRSSWTLS